MKDIVPNDETIAEILDILAEFDPNPEIYPRQLQILLDNMNERRYYSGARNDLGKYIELIKKTGLRTADESDIKQGLYKKLRKGNVIPDSINYPTSIPGKSGDIVTLSKIRIDNALNEK